MRSERAWRIRLAVAALTLLAGRARGDLIERVLAVVDGSPVMSSEAAAVARLKGTTTEVALEALIDERLMLREAARLPEAAVRPEEEERVFQDLAGRLDPRQRAAIGDAYLRTIARRQTVILKYVDFRPQVRVDELEIREAYEDEYGGQPGAPAYESVAAQIQSRLVRQALDARIEAWVKELRSGAEIRYNPEPGPAS